MSKLSEAALATILKIMARNQSALQELAKGVTKLADEKEPQIVQIPNNSGEINKIDENYAAIVESLAANTQQLVKLTESLLFTKKPEKPGARPALSEWTFEIERDTSGFIKAVDAKPKRLN